MRLAWGWASLSSQLGASASRATTNPSLPESCRQLTKSRTCCSTFWARPCHTRVHGSTCTSTKSLPMQQRTATGEAKVHPRWVSSSLWLCFSIDVLRSASSPCRRYVNALEAASANFASNIDREMLRGDGELKAAMEPRNRHSNSGSFLSYFFLDWQLFTSPTQCC